MGQAQSGILGILGMQVFIISTHVLRPSPRTLRAQQRMRHCSQGDLRLGPGILTFVPWTPLAVL